MHRIKVPALEAGAEGQPDGERRLDVRSLPFPGVPMPPGRFLLACYEKALQCASDPELIARWNTALVEARTRLAELGPHRASTREAGPLDCLIDAMELARRNGDPAATQAVACECVRLAEAHHAGLLGAGRVRSGGVRQPSGLERRMRLS
jgi:hypothetical protein